MRSKHCFYALLSACSILLGTSCSSATASSGNVTPSKCNGDEQKTVMIKASAPATVFFPGEKLEFQGTEGVKCTLTDWRGNKLREDSFDANGKLQLAPLPAGYYELHVQNGAQKITRSFAIVPYRPAAQRNPEMCYAFDTALSWMPMPYPLTAEATYRSGASIVRDRISWRGCEKISGQMDFSVYLKKTNELKKRNVAICTVFHDAPKYLLEDKQKMPADLYRIYLFCQALGNTFKDRMTAWEFWNEQDTGFTSEGAWDYASAMKAAYLGFKSADKNQAVAFGGIAQTFLPASCDTMFENDLKEYIDIFNVHSYIHLASYPKSLTNIGRFMEKYGIFERPLWFTEVGTTAEGSGRLQREGRKTKEQDRDQELIVAEMLPKQMLTMQFFGVNRCFWFVLPPYYENSGAKVWGLIRDDYSVKPAYCAFAGLAENLGFAEMEGEVNIGKDLKAYLFRQKDGKQTLAYWQISELETEENRPNRKFTEPAARNFQLNVPAGTYHGSTIFSTPFTAESINGTLTLKAERFVNYIHGLSGIKVTHPGVKRPLKMTAESSTLDRTIVYQVKLGKMFNLACEKESADLKEKTGTVELVIWNLSPADKCGEIKISNCRTDRIPEKIEIKPFSKVTIPMKITPQFKDGCSKFTVSGTFNGKRTSSLVLPITNPAEIINAAKIEKKFQQMEDPANWKTNSAGKMEIGFDEKESAVVFQGTFPPKVDRWIYPRYELQLPQESMKGAKYIAFEWKIDTDQPPRLAILMCAVKKKNGKDVLIHIPVSKQTGIWVKNIVSLQRNNIDTEDITAFQIGMNPSTDKIRYSVRNIRILY